MVHHRTLTSRGFTPQKTTKPTPCLLRPQFVSPRPNTQNNDHIHPSHRREKPCTRRTTGHACTTAYGRVQKSFHLVEARLEVKALALLVHGPQVPVQRGLVPLGPTALTRRTAALEYVLKLLLARAAAEDGFTQRELSSEAPVKCRTGRRQDRGGTRGVTRAIRVNVTGGHGSSHRVDCDIFTSNCDSSVAPLCSWQSVTSQHFHLDHSGGPRLSSLLSNTLLPDPNQGPQVLDSVPQLVRPQVKRAKAVQSANLTPLPRCPSQGREDAFDPPSLLEPSPTEQFWRARHLSSQPQQPR